MADHSKIEWTETTWNPVTGCTRVSEGCDHCYIERTPPFRMAGCKFDRPGIGGTTGVTLYPERLDQPLAWRKPRRVFVNSLSDLFHSEVPDDFVVEVFARMWWAPTHTFQVLTKRPTRARSLLPRIEAELRQRESDLALVDCPTALTWPLPNVWLGTSVESQRWADIRIPILLDTPAAVRWLSCEPLLGPVDLTYCAGVNALAQDWAGGPGGGTGAPHPFVDWVVVGGESGPGARPMHPDWARSLRDQCAAASVPFFFKQWGEWQDGSAAGVPMAGERVALRDGRAWTWDDWNANARQVTAAEKVGACVITRVGKKRAGRELDGRTHDDYPVARSAEALELLGAS